MKYKFSLWASIINFVYFITGFVSNIALIILYYNEYKALLNVLGHENETILIICIALCVSAVIVDIVGMLVALSTIKPLAADSTDKYKSNRSKINILMILDGFIFILSAVLLLLYSTTLATISFGAGTISLLCMMFYYIDMCRENQKVDESQKNIESEVENKKCD